VSREYQPGDVAMVGVAIGFMVEGGAWYHADESWTRSDSGVPIRPLVVLDPEDREQVERLLAIYAEPSIRSLNPVAALQHALRELANPPTPPCGASLALGKVALYRCSESVGHAGPHVDGTQTWSVES